jgi:hypothetical protein
MWPSPNGEHIHCEQLSMKGKPAKKFVLQLGVGSSDFRGED